MRTDVRSIVIAWVAVAALAGGACVFLPGSVQARSVNGPLAELYGETADTVAVPAAPRLLWSEGARPRSQLEDLLTGIRNAGASGLAPGDYDLARLESGWERVRNGATGEAELAELDRTTSRAFLQLLSDLHYGRVDPAKLGVGFKLARAEYDLAAAVRTAVERNRIAEELAAAEPKIPQYAALKAALPRYRRLAVAPLPILMPVGKLVPGDSYPGVQKLMTRLAATGDLPPEEAIRFGLAVEDYTAWMRPPANPWTGAGEVPHVYGGPVVEAMKRFQDRHGLDADGVIGTRTWMALSASMAQRARQIELALERWRWLPQMKEGRFVLVNVPAFTLYGFESPARMDTPALSMRVVVGKEGETNTPVFSDEMRYIVFRPYWYPPPSIIQKEIVKELETDPLYLEKHNMEIVSEGRENGGATILPSTPESIELLRSGDLSVRQRPGPKNSLGLIKFIFPNNHAVYMHDTPSRSLFSRQRRDFSHGCIRVQNPVELARFVLWDQPEWTSEAIGKAMQAEEKRTVSLKHPVPVYIIYATAMPRADGTMEFYEDIYARDAELERALKAAAKGTPARSGAAEAAVAPRGTDRS